MARGGTAGRTGVRDDSGAAMAEYMPLLAVIALVVMFAFAFLGPWVRERLIDASVPLAGCPPPFELSHPEDPPPPARGVERDLNGDGYLCVQYVPGSGIGNTGMLVNVKDNTRP